MIGFNGGLIGATRIYAATGANSGVWSLDEIIPIKRTVVASGGDTSDVVDGGITYRVHSFTTTGDTSFIVSTGGLVEYLIQGAGSGGNAGTGGVNYGNGGAAGVARSDSLVVTPQTYTITVGAGSAGVVQANSLAGGSSSALGITATGGNGSLNAGRTGASNADYIGGTNTAVGANSGGGAGAGANGNLATGGNGFTSSITGVSVVRGGGGGGVTNNVGVSGGTGGGGAGVTTGTGGHGTANTGSGGGAGGAGGGGNGGSGIVIIRYPI
jgi:hypothetical protein